MSLALAVPIRLSSKLAGVLKPPRGFSSRKNRDPSQGPGMKGQGPYSK
jgi:hypothetical protein